MLTAIEARSYRCLQSVRQPLGRFNVLVGPNGSGKTTFLDVLLFLRSLLSEGLRTAITDRTPDFQRLLWTDSFLPLNPTFWLAVSAGMPEGALNPSPEGAYDMARYAVCVGSHERGRAEIMDEQVCLANNTVQQATSSGRAAMFSMDIPGGKSLLILPPALSPRERLVSSQIGPPERYVVRMDPDRTVLDRLPSSGFLVTHWLRHLLTQNIYYISLDSKALRLPSRAPVTQDPLLIMGGGGYLPWLVNEICQPSYEAAMQAWMAHVRTALPDIESVRDIEREEDRSRFLMVRYRNGAELPSWVVSDGTLRLLALTILPHVPRPGGIYLIEEPENSLHPHNIETVMQSLQSVYKGQVLVATHSPLVLSQTRPEDILVFSRDEHQGTTITVGSEHPGLRDWKGEVNLGTLFAGGVLG